MAVDKMIKVASTSNPNSVAGMIVSLIKSSGRAEVDAIGAGALNQAIKSVAIARGYIAPEGINLVCIPAFTEIAVQGEDKTGIKLIVKEER